MTRKAAIEEGSGREKRERDRERQRETDRERQRERTIVYPHGNSNSAERSNLYHELNLKFASFSRVYIYIVTLQKQGKKKGKKWSCDDALACKVGQIA